ncbi:MAG TPA: TIGR03936 family radical SAM-associated protein [Mycobacteriales bacterium]|nr:TIGR03936 family radical SAM-associated protein [Mycobacteriales bacterium]
MSSRAVSGLPPHPQAPVVQRLRVRYAKRGRLRFTSHRDIQRAVERALRRSGVPIAFSAGFSPHPKISYLGAAPTGTASEAEYLELGLADPREPDQVRRALDAALPAGLDVLEVVEAGPGSLAERIDASSWRIRLDGIATVELARAVALFLAAESLPVERLTKDGRRVLDARAPVIRLVAGADPDGCAILDLVVRHVTPAVRPDDVLAGLLAVADLVLPAPPTATRRAQGLLEETGRLADPLAPDRPADATGPAAG